MVSRTWYSLILVLACSACASSFDLKSGPSPLGGGIDHQEVKPGLHSIYVRTNFAPWENFSGARSAWTQVADSKCGPAGHTELKTRESANRRLGDRMTVPAIHTEREGFALCKNASTSLQEAEAYIKAKATQ